MPFYCPCGHRLSNNQKDLPVCTVDQILLLYLEGSLEIVELYVADHLKGVNLIQTMPFFFSPMNQPSLEIELITTSFIGTSALKPAVSVGVDLILSMTSNPDVTFPKTQYPNPSMSLVL